MSEAKNQEKVPSSEKTSAQARLAEALRENLRRRKAQSRARNAKIVAKGASEPDLPA